MKDTREITNLEIKQTNVNLNKVFFINSEDLIKLPAYFRYGIGMVLLTKGVPRKYIHRVVNAKLKI